ncbi:MAG: hypothetical protein LC777_01885, partial [Actinobacteria bacterium]|nr:hypothetical protein [Actinomycetota bacterium]
MTDKLEQIERIIEASGMAERIEARLPAGVRPRQLSVRTLLIGMTLAMLSGREAFLRSVHKTLLELPAAERLRLGVIAQWKDGPHQLTYRQLEYTFKRVARTLAKPTPDGNPSKALSEMLDALLEASVTVLGEPDSSSYAVDWTDQETWSRPPRKRTEQAAPQDQGPASDDDDPQPPPAQRQPSDPEPAAEQQPQRCADPEASWGHRRGNNPGQTDESFYGYYLQAVTIVNDEHGPEVPELARRIHLASCDHDPPAALVPVIQQMHQSGIQLGDLLADSGYSYRVASDWALPLRTLGAQLIQDPHPNDRGPNGTHHGAIRANGNLYCPATPTALLELSPLARGASEQDATAHDQRCHELARYKLSPISGYDPDGYRRVICPAAQGKLRCPLRPESMTLSHQHPTILAPPDNPPTCCQ